MTYEELWLNATYLLDHNKITLGEFEEMIEPLKHEISEQTEPQRNMAEDIVRSFDFKAESYRQAKAKTEPQIDDFFREPTAEERKAVADYIDSISVPTGVNVFDLMDESQTCDTCRYDKEPWHRQVCDECTVGESNWEPKDEPQTDCRRCRHYATDKCKECFGHELFTDSGYATDCSWQKGE